MPPNSFRGTLPVHLHCWLRNAVGASPLPRIVPAADRPNQSEHYAREGVDLSLLTLAYQVGARAAALKPLHSLIEAHVLAAGRLHGDDTTVPILAKGTTDKGHIWTYVRDDRPFGGLFTAGCILLHLARSTAVVSATPP